MWTLKEAYIKSRGIDYQKKSLRI
ncbi:hypothetical protein IC611_21345 [Proteus mirabilis]